MSIRYVGKDISASEYWRQRGYSSQYSENSGGDNIEGAYHTHRLEVIKTLIKNCKVDAHVCLDVGCGDGILLEYLARAGGQVIGFDLAEDMVNSARKRLAKNGLKGQLSVGGLETLKSIETESVDYLFALNVIAYFTDEEEAFFYREAARVMKEGGALIVTHSNELFDLYTLNVFTLEFFAGHFCGVDHKAKISSLLTHPNKPEKVSFNIRENPLAYKYKLADYGFEEAQQEFANFHELPPFLLDPDILRDIDQRKYLNHFRLG